MNLKILAGIILYYSLTTLFFFFANAAGVFTDYSHTANISAIDTSEETETGGLFSVGISFARFWLFTSFGLIPGDIPAWFQIIFSTWQIGFNLFAVGWLIASVWNG